MRRTTPVAGTALEPLPPLDDASALDLQARIHAYATDEVKDGVDAVLLIRRRFQLAAGALADVQRPEASGRFSPGDNAGRNYAQLDEMRVDANTKLNEPRALIRDEL